MLKRFEKLQYMVIGAVLMAVGIGIGSIFTPPLVAQRNNVFDEIICHELIVVGPNGDDVVTLGSSGNGGAMSVFDYTGKSIMKINSTMIGNAMVIYDSVGRESISLFGTMNERGVFLSDTSGKEVVKIGVAPGTNSVEIYGSDGGDFLTTLHARPDASRLVLSDENGKVGMILQGNSADNHLLIYNDAGGFKKYTGETILTGPVNPNYQGK